MGEVAASTIGIVIVCWTLREVFADLFQPSGSGSLSSWLSKTLFRIGKRARWMLSAAGPLSIVVVIFCWVILISIGFALIFWARFPESFANTSGEYQDPASRFWSMLYFSVSALTTLGSTDFTPRGNWIRIAAGVESLIGFSIVTASITWVVLIYPALGRMRTLARRASTLARAQKETGIDVLSTNSEGLLTDLAQNVIRTRVDFIHFPIIYYFHADTEGSSLGQFLLHLREFAERAGDEKRPENVRLGGALLRLSLDDLAEVLCHKYLPETDKNDSKAIFDAVAKDHLEQQ